MLGFTKNLFTPFNYFHSHLPNIHLIKTASFQRDKVILLQQNYLLSKGFSILNDNGQVLIFKEGKKSALSIPTLKKIFLISLGIRTDIKTMLFTLNNTFNENWI